KASFQIGRGTTIELSDWRAAGDRRIPMQVKVTSMDGEIETYKADAVKPISPGDVHVAMPKSLIADATFDPAKPAIVESSFAGKSHIKVRAQVSGQDVGWFILDSGAGGMVIGKTLADALDLKRVGSSSASAVGGTIELGIRGADKFEIG